MIDVVGLTARGWPDLPEQQRDLVTGADVLLGAPRQLDLVPTREGQTRTTWPSPLREGLPGLLDRATGRVVALASGDPLVSGIGGTLVGLLGADRVRIHPAVSSVALARARLGWPAEITEVVSVVGRSLDRVRRHLLPGARLVVLSSGADTPGDLARLLVDSGYGGSRMTAYGHLGTDQESERRATAADWAGEVPALNVVGIDCEPDPGTRVLGLVPGLPDDAYDHDGQLTKRDVRASALAHLVPLPGQLLWDVGSGAGSVAIEWSRTSPTCRAVAVERDPARAARIARNAARLGVPELRVVAEEAPDALDDLPAPDAVFVGGGATPDLLDRCWQRLRPGGRLVAHAVTLETEAVLLDAQTRHGGSLTRISVETVRPLGGYRGWQPARAVVQWSAIKEAR